MNTSECAARDTHTHITYCTQTHLFNFLYMPLISSLWALASVTLFPLAESSRYLRAREPAWNKIGRPLMVLFSVKCATFVFVDLTRFFFFFFEFSPEQKWNIYRANVVWSSRKINRLYRFIHADWNGCEWVFLKALKYKCWRTGLYMVSRMCLLNKNKIE